jgi:CRISPR/Cas system-associated exonuclease Cas4 (RecB family)
MPHEIDRPHWSYSSISQYLKCPLQFYFERIRKLPKKTTSDAQVLGSSIHTALAHYHRQLQAHEPIPEDPVREVFLAAWESHSQRTEIVHTGDRSTDDNLYLGMALIEAYLEELPPTNILAIEQPLLAPITNSQGEVLERPLLVVPDLITRQDDGTLKVNEIKTSGRALAESEVATSLQPTCYASALYELTGEEPIVELTVLVKTRVPRVQRIEAVRTIADLGRMGDLVEVVERAVEAEIFYPQESPLNCSTCPFFRDCREWTGPGTSKSVDSHVHVIQDVSAC